MKEHQHIGCYGLFIKNEKILLIKKKTGPYDGLLDLPGGSFEFGETPEETLKREFQEETSFQVKKDNLQFLGSKKQANHKLVTIFITQDNFDE